jgi:cold shock protein
VPTGKVKWYEPDKGFGFITSDDGSDVFLHISALPEGVKTLKGGTRVEFGIADGKRGRQALTVRVLEPAQSVVKATRKPAGEMAVIVETLTKLLDDVGDRLKNGHYPDDQHSARVAKLLRAVADDLDV